MAFVNMYQELLGIPGTNLGLVKTKINEAFAAIQNENMWSFQIKQGGWLTPGILGGPNDLFLSPGTITVVPFTQTITADAVATAAWLAPVPYPPLLTQQQIRVPYYSLYNIIAVGSAPTVAYLTINTPGSGQMAGAYTVNATGGGGTGAQAEITVNQDGTVTIPPTITNPGSGYTSAPTFTLVAGGTPATFTATLNATVTIDRPWTEPSQNAASYIIYEAYYPAPQGFKKFFWIVDSVNNNNMDFWSKTELDLANDDPQRTIFDQPYYVVQFGPDTRQGSATYGDLRFELWPQPISQLCYPFSCLCNWPALVNPNDTVPYPLNDEIVKLRAYEMLYLWKASQVGDDQERGSGANWQFLIQAARDEYEDRLKRIRIMDRHLVEVYFTRARVSPPFGQQPFATVSGQINVGGWDG